MRRNLLVVALVLAPLFAACAGPISNRELFPVRNTDPTVGLLRNRGTTSLNVWVYDQANRLVEEIYFPPAREPLSPLAVNQLRDPVTVVKTLAPGSYRVEYIPFYYQWGVFSGRQRVDLPRGSSSIFVGRDPNRIYDRETGRHWGWILELNGGDVPKDPVLQNINFSIRCC